MRPHWGGGGGGSLLGCLFPELFPGLWIWSWILGMYLWGKGLEGEEQLLKIYLSLWEAVGFGDKLNASHRIEYTMMLIETLAWEKVNKK